MSHKIRTDLALERWELAHSDAGRATDGVTHRCKTMHGIEVHTMEIHSEDAATDLCKPCGFYYTISMEKAMKRQSEGFLHCVYSVSHVLRQLLPRRRRVLVACLGNPAITPDSVGPLTAGHLMVTRHLKAHLPETFAEFGEVSVICPGVLGTTGIESAMLVKGAVDAVKPDAVIAVDALAASEPDRLCRTIQICNTGIAPGSGVGNRRYALNRETLGVPVIAAGVPTVLDAGALIQKFTAPVGAAICRPPNSTIPDMMVTPREIDTCVADSAKLLGYGINFALHDGLTLEDVDLFVS